MLYRLLLWVAIVVALVLVVQPSLLVDAAVGFVDWLVGTVWQAINPL